MSLSLFDIVILVIVGAAAGSFGGLLGVGGSVIMIPAMALLLGARVWFDQHVAQAAAMCVNVAVAIPAALRHSKAGALRTDLMKWMLPAALVSIVAGVLLSNTLPAQTLARVFALFLVYVVVDGLIKFVRNRPDPAESRSTVTPVRGSAVGVAMGGFAGLLGIGGGAIAVPTALVVCRLPLRQAIAASAATMAMTAGVGAVLKLATLHEVERDWMHALIVALVLAPSALLAGRFGAGLTHALPLRLIRAIFILVMALAALEMAGVL